MSSSLEDQHSRFELKTLLDTSKMLIESHDMEFVLNNLLLITMGKLMVSKGMIILYQPSRNNYLVSKSKGRACPQEGSTLSFEWDDSVKEQAVIRTHDNEVDLPAQLEGVSSGTFFNLRTSNHHIGFLCLGPKGNKQPLSKREVEFVESLVIISSVAIANSRMFEELRRINRKLDRKVYELNTLFDLSKDFNMMVDRDEISRVFKFAMLGQLLIRKFFFLLETDSQREVVTTSGIRQAPSKEVIEQLFDLDEDMLRVDEQLADNIPFLADNQIEALIALRFQNEKIGLVGVGPRANKEHYTDSDLNFISSLGNLALLSIQKTLLLEERIDKERMEEELNIARTIQEGLLPSPLPEISNLDITATNLSSQQVGGDYYDLIETPEHNFLLAIADVTGKGVPAALLMANLQAMLHALTPIDITLAEATNRINDIIYNNTPSDKFITFFWAKYMPPEHSFSYVNAGHNPPVLLRKNSDTPEELEAGGLILGAMSTMMPYESSTVILEPGDQIVFYTDGVTEALNPAEDEEYGEERLYECILKHRELSSEGMKDAIIEDINRFSNHKQYDDVTVIVLKVKD